jgi:hypothetical protein
LILILDPIKFKFLYIFGVSSILIFTLLVLFYGIFVILPEDSSMANKWSDKNNKEIVSKIENSLDCCGYDDPLMSSSSVCVLSSSGLSTCKEIIDSELSYRTKTLFIFTISSTLFGIYSIKVLIDLLKGKGSDGKTTDFEDLIESV